MIQILTIKGKNEGARTHWFNKIYSVLNKHKNLKDLFNNNKNHYDMKAKIVI